MPPATDAAENADGAAAAAASTPASYLFGPHDVINIAVVGRTDYNQQVLVQDDGTVSLALIGSLTVTNLTPLQLKAVIERKLRSGGYFLNPEVTVTLQNAASQYAVLLGDIGRPGLAPLDRIYHLSELLARSGGVREGADVVKVTPPNGETTQFSLRTIAIGGSIDPLIAPGTKVYVLPPEVFYIYGQIGRPGTFPIDPAGMTVRNALARAGGLSQLGSSKKIRIFRGDQEIKNVKLSDPIKPNDTIKIGERLF